MMFAMSQFTALWVDKRWQTKKRRENYGNGLAKVKSMLPARTHIIVGVDANAEIGLSVFDDNNYKPDPISNAVLQGCI